MAPVFDASSYFTRRQSDARYVHLPPIPGPPTGVSFGGSTIVATATELTATETCTLTPPAGDTIVAYQFLLTDPFSNITTQILSTASPLVLIDLLVNATYTVQVRSLDFFNQASTYTSAQMFTTSDAVPMLGIPNLTVTIVALGAQATLSPLNTELWFDFYQLNRSTSVTMSSSTNVIEFKAASVIDKDIPATASYYYQVQAFDDFGNSVLTNIVGPISLTESTVLSAPAQPNISGGTITSNSDGSITITWPGNTETSLTNYRILRRVHGTSLWEDYDWIGATPGITGTYTDINTSSGTEYDYTVSAINSANEESTYDIAGYQHATSSDTDLPTAPTSLTFANGQGFVTAMWVASPSSDVVEYEVSWRLQSTDAFYSGILVSGTSFTIWGLASTKAALTNEIEIRVRARENNGNFSTYLDPGALTFLQLVNYSPASGNNPPNPLEVSTIANVDGSVTLNWTAPSGSYSEFRIMRYDTILAEWAWLADIPISQITYTDLYLEPFTYLSRVYEYSIQTIAIDGSLSSWNQLYNSGFEFSNASPVGWTFASGGGAVDNIVHTPVDFGANALQANNLGTASQNLPVIVGKNYYFSADVYEDTVPANAEVQITWYNVSMGVISQISNSVTTNGTWQTVTVTGVAPALAVTATFTLLGDTGNPTFTMIWDDARFELIDTGDTVSSVYGDNKSSLTDAVDTIAPIQTAGQLALRVAGVLGGVHVNWVTGLTPRFLGALYQVYEATTELGTYSLVGTVPVWSEGVIGFFAVTNINPLVRTTYWYNIDVQDIYGNTSGYINSTPISATSQNLNDAQEYGDGSTPPAPVVLDTLQALIGGGFQFTFEFEGGPYQNVIDHYNIYRYTSNVSASASVIRAIPQGNGQMVVQDQVGSFSPTTFYYWVSAVDIYNNESALTPAQLVGTSTTTVLDNVPDGSSYVRLASSHAVDNVAYNLLGAWSSATAYVVGDEVTYLGNYWLAILANTNQTPFAPGSPYWQILGPVVLDNLNDGPTFKKLQYVHPDHTIHVSTALNPQSSTIPTVTTLAPFTYVAKSTSGQSYITWDWTTITLYRPDGTTVTVPASSLNAIPSAPVVSQTPGGSLARSPGTDFTGAADTTVAQSGTIVSDPALTLVNIGGYLLICSVRWDGGTTLNSISDTNLNSWSSAGPAQAITGGGQVQLWYAPNAIAGTNALTFNFSGNSTAIWGTYAQFSNVAPTSPLDVGTSSQGQSIIAISKATFSSPNVTYTYTLTSGPALTTDMYISITGFLSPHTADNGIFPIASLGTGTFTVVNSAGSTVTAVAAGLTMPTSPSITGSAGDLLLGFAGLETGSGITSLNETGTLSLNIGTADEIEIGSYAVGSGSSVHANFTFTGTSDWGAGIASFLGGVGYSVMIGLVDQDNNIVGISSVVSTAVDPNHLLVVNSPTAVANYSGWVPIVAYVGTGFFVQGSTIAFGTNWTEPSSGLVTTSTPIISGDVANTGNFLFPGLIGGTLYLFYAYSWESTLVRWAGGANVSASYVNASTMFLDGNAPLAPATGMTVTTPASSGSGGGSGGGCVRKGSTIVPLGWTGIGTELPQSDWVELKGENDCHLIATPDHPIFTEDCGKVPLSSIHVGDLVLTDKGSTRVTEIHAFFEEGIKVVLTMPGGHLYWAGEPDSRALILGHNIKP